MQFDQVSAAKLQTRVKLYVVIERFVFIPKILHTAENSATVSQNLCQARRFRLKAPYAPTLLLYKLDSLSNLPVHYPNLGSLSEDQTAVYVFLHNLSPILHVSVKLSKFRGVSYGDLLKIYCDI